jgi:hypothetical protein
MSQEITVSRIDRALHIRLDRAGRSSTCKGGIIASRLHLASFFVDEGEASGHEWTTVFCGDFNHSVA